MAVKLAGPADVELQRKQAAAIEASGNIDKALAVLRQAEKNDPRDFRTVRCSCVRVRLPYCLARAGPALPEPCVNPIDHGWHGSPYGLRDCLIVLMTHQLHIEYACTLPVTSPQEPRMQGFSQDAGKGWEEERVSRETCPS